MKLDRKLIEVLRSWGEDSEGRFIEIYEKDLAAYISGLFQSLKKPDADVSRIPETCIFDKALAYGYNDRNHELNEDIDRLLKLLE